MCQYNNVLILKNIGCDPRHNNVMVLGRSLTYKVLIPKDKQNA